jgi:membrane-associated protease RseP (regulator of RpoE activity)
MITFGAFIIILGTLIFKDRDKVRFEGLAFIRRTDKANRFIDKTAKSHRSAWKTLSIIGIAVGIPVMIIGSIFMIMTAADVASGKLSTGGAGIVLPGPVASPQAIPGVFVVPWWIWIIGIACVIIPHEFFHGIMFRLERIRVKSVGWVVFIVLPGAFVEPDEIQLQKSKRSTKLKAYAAGSFANLLVALIIAIILVVSTTLVPLSEPTGLFFQQINNTPASSYNITGVIVAINGVTVHTQQELSLELENHAAGDIIPVTTRKLAPNASVFFNGKYNFVVPQAALYANLGEEKTTYVELAENPETKKAFLGVTNIVEIHSTENLFIIQIINLLVWIYVFSFGIGLVNLLPIKPLDGGLLFEELVGKFTTKTKIIVRTVSIIMLAVLLFNIFGVFFV